MGRAADLPHVFSVIQQVFVEHLLHARTGVAVLTGTDMFPQSLLSGGRLMIRKNKHKIIIDCGELREEKNEVGGEGK